MNLHFRLHNFSKVTFFFFPGPPSIASLVSDVCNMAPFQIAVYFKPSSSGLSRLQFKISFVPYTATGDFCAINLHNYSPHLLPSSLVSYT